MPEEEYSENEFYAQESQPLSGISNPDVLARFIKQLVHPDIPDEISGIYFKILTSQDIPLGQLTKSDIEEIKATLDLVALYDLRSRPPSESIFNYIKLDGNGGKVKKKMDMDFLMISNLIEMYMAARMSRGREGFERRMQTQSTQVHITEGVGEKRSFLDRIFGGKK
ncbi:MAG: hypothetical protein ACXQTR_05020 [Candidatus Methanospirareceae archaeon]